MKVKHILKYLNLTLASILLLVGVFIIGAHLLEGDLPKDLSPSEIRMSIILISLFVGAFITYFHRFWSALVLLIAYSAKLLFEGIDFNLYLDLFLLLSILNFYLYYLEINDKNK